MSILGETGNSIIGMPVEKFLLIHEDAEKVKKVATSRVPSKMAFIVRAKLDANQYGRTKRRKVLFTAVRSM